MSKNTMSKLPMHVTKNDTPHNVKSVMIDVLNKRLNDGIAVSLNVKQAHWNLRGKSFIGVHLMLDKFRSELDSFTDLMAERVVQLGGTAMGTVDTVNSLSKIPEYSLTLVSIDQHLSALVSGHAVFANALRKDIATAEEAGDAGTADLLTEVSRGVDMQLWFLEAHEPSP